MFQLWDCPICLVLQILATLSTELFYDSCLAEGAFVNVHDTLVDFWYEKNLSITNDLEVFSQSSQHDVVVFSIAHKEYVALSSQELVRLFEGVKLVIDASNTINDSVAVDLLRNGIKVLGVGKGHWKDL